MKKLILMVGTLLLVASGCSSTMSVGPKANESRIVGANAGVDGASVTVPFLSLEVGPDN